MSSYAVDGYVTEGYSVNLGPIRSRLSKLQDSSLRFQELADALDQLFWPEQFDGEWQKLDNLRSIFTAGNEGCLEIARELGWYFEADITDDNRAMQILMRKWELARKDSEFPLKMTLQRIGYNLGNGDAVTYRQLFAWTSRSLEHNNPDLWDTPPLRLMKNDPHDATYPWATEPKFFQLLPGYDGEYFTEAQAATIAAGEGLAIEKMFTLTSRIKVFVAPDLEAAGGAELLARIEQRVRAVKPLHIVLQAVVYGVPPVA